MRLLLDKGIDVSVSGKDGDTALFRAAVDGSESTVKLLLERGANTRHANEKGWAALQNAAQNG